MKWMIAVLVFGRLAIAEGEAVSFSREIVPILQAKCLACHSAEKAKGGYRVHTFSAVATTGKSDKAAVVAGKPEASEMFQRLITYDEDDRMPQEEDALPAEQIALFRRWIAEGAKLDNGSPDAPLNLLAPKKAHALPPENYPRPVPIVALAFQPDGEILAVSGYNEITLWNVKGELQRRISNAPPRIRGLAFHPMGGYLAAVGGKPGREGELSIYNVSTDQLETNLARASDELLALAFSADGKLLAAGGSENAIHLFSWETREKIATIQQHADWVTALRFNGDGSRIASASRDRTARVYNTTTGDLEATYPTHNTSLFAVGYVSEHLVASGGRDRKIHFWSVEDGKKKGEVGGFGADIHQLIISGESMFTACGDKLIRQHSTGDRKLIRTFSGHADATYAIAVHATSGRLASGSYDGEVRVWNIADGTLISNFIAAPGLKPLAN